MATSNELIAVAQGPPPPSQGKPNLNPDAPDNPTEQSDDAMDADADDSAMMAMMGLNGFGSTKVDTHCTKRFYRNLIDMH